jgi:N12 class adenine-specific DNA methylase
VTSAVGKVDEAHHYKNKQRVCNIDELSCPAASQRAEDLGLKLEVLRQRRRDEAVARGIPEHAIVERVATFATGTPIANSLGELWVMQTYLRPDLLEAAGVADLGDWGAAFTATHTSIEVNATGTKLRPVTRVAKYTNLPELLALSNAFTDVVTRDQVPVKLPEYVPAPAKSSACSPTPNWSTSSPTSDGAPTISTRENPSATTSSRSAATAATPH